jgi:hypothetical protein
MQLKGGPSWYQCIAPRVWASFMVYNLSLGFAKTSTLLQYLSVRTQEIPNDLLGRSRTLWPATLSDSVCFRICLHANQLLSVRTPAFHVRQQLRRMVSQGRHSRHI